MVCHMHKEIETLLHPHHPYHLGQGNMILFYALNARERIHCHGWMGIEHRMFYVSLRYPVQPLLSWIGIVLPPLTSYIWLYHLMALVYKF